MTDVQEAKATVVETGPQVCIDCGKGIAVTTAGLCEVCDRNLGVH